LLPFFGDIRIADLRQERRARVPISTLRALMGYSEVGTTMRYVDIAEGDNRDVIACAF
jgi:hypothetical protein